MRRGPQRLDRVHRRAVARDAEYRRAGLGDRDTDRAGEALADAAAAAGEVIVRAREGERLEEIEVRRDGLVDHDGTLGRAGLHFGHAARHRGRRARPRLLDARLLCRFSRLLLRLKRLVALGGVADPGSAATQRFERRTGVGEHAGIEREIVGKACRRRLDLQHLAARRERRARRVPHLLEERPADHQHEIVVGEVLGHTRRIEGERAAIGGMIGRERCAAAQAFEPDRGAELLRQAHQRLDRAGARHVVAGDDGRALAPRPASSPWRRCPPDRDAIAV